MENLRQKEKSTKKSLIETENRLEEKILDALTRTKNDFISFEKELLQLKKKYGNRVYSKFLSSVSHFELDPKSARAHFNNIKEHHQKMVESLKRDIDIRVAVADYFVSSKKIKEPIVLELHIYKKTLEVGFKDSLTKLYNYSYFKEAFKHELAHSKRYLEPLSLIFFDLDNFKKLNDEYGHEAGNLVLRKVAKIIKSSIREVDIPIRYGGEEFIIILPKTDKFGALAVGERIRKKVSEEKFRTLKRSVTISGGIASFPYDDKNGEFLISKADEAMYRAKASGKNRIELYSEEKRAFERQQNQFIGTIEFSGLKAKVLGKNLSPIGFYVEAQKFIPPESKVHFTISFSKSERIEGEGLITRVEEHDQNSYGFGIKITSLNKRDREKLFKVAKLTLE